MRIRRLALPAALALAAGLLGLPSQLQAEASCVGPSIAVGDVVDPGNPPTFAPVLRSGQAVRVAGSWFHSGCADTSTVGWGCAGPAPAADPEAPLTRVRLELQQSGRSWLLDTQDAGDRASRYGVRWTGAIPSGVQPGAAELQAGQARLAVTIT